LEALCGKGIVTMRFYRGDILMTKRVNAAFFIRVVHFS
jgi:hypothetical protein